MAKGDIIAGYLSAAGCFQPAAGVECVLTSLSVNTANNATRGWSHDNGLQRGYYCTVPTSPNGSSMNTKIFISNSDYIRCSGEASYTGIQIK